MITIHQFKQLTMDMQVEELQSDGVFLDVSRADKKSEVFLYALHDYYVELYVQVTTNELLHLKCFTTISKLDAYLDQVDISEIKSLLSPNT